MTEVIDDVSDHVLSVRGSSGMLLTRMKYIIHVLRRYLLHAPCDPLFFFFFWGGLLALCLFVSRFASFIL